MGCPVCGCQPAQPHPGLPPGRPGLLLAWLAGNYHRPLRAAEIAAAAGLSVRALQATCQREFGRTPFQLLTDIRLHHARLALTTSEPQPGSVAEVARSAGFTTRLTRFTAAYRRRYGTPPAITARITLDPHDIPPAVLRGQHSRAGCLLNRARPRARMLMRFAYPLALVGQPRSAGTSGRKFLATTAA